MRERHPHDRFDNARTHSKRVGAHRAAGALPRRHWGWLVAVLAVVVLVLGGIVYIAVQNGKIDFTAPTSSSTAQPSEEPSDGASDNPDDGGTDENGGDTGESQAPPSETPTTGAVDKTASIYVLNGTTTTGLSAGASTRLNQAGWTQQINVGNAKSKSIRQSVVYYHDDAGESAARGVAAALGIQTVTKSQEYAKNNAGGPAPANQVVAVLGTDYSASR
ncbi:LytR C-terminal domain-containing protein [Mycetocola sp. JXN-3]|uniref:LytR C-terminal domain-containing protein n=1 Tax=Mycetocola sp. JXN-3 TaxID=2116510 RepID=UPI00165D0B86|nr:LytR C-terminal domain-containing protein [Mycetocola sp. JXN-3]